MSKYDMLGLGEAITDLSRSCQNMLFLKITEINHRFLGQSRDAEMPLKCELYYRRG